VIKPAYSVSFQLSINIFVWQNVLYFPNFFRTLRFKEKKKRAVVVANATVHKQGIIQRFKFAGRLFHTVSGLYKDFTRMSPSEFEFLINFIGEKDLE